MTDPRWNPATPQTAEFPQRRVSLPLACLAWLALCVPACVSGHSGNGSSNNDNGGSGNPSTAPGAGADGSVFPGGGAGGAASTMPGSTPLGFNCKAGTVDPGPSPMKLLSRGQYLNSVRDLVGTVSGLDGALGASSNASAFGLVQPDVAQVDLENYRNAATTVAASVVTNAKLLNQLAACADDALKRDCAKAFVQSFAARAYRAPVTDAADLELHLKLYDVGAKVSYAHGIELLIQGILQAPRFLYRVEIGTGEQVSESAVKLSPYELASRLSFSIWDSLPDAKLTQAARNGELATKEGVAAQLSWMLQDTKGQNMVRRFLENWIHLPDLDNSAKDASLYPQWTNTTLKASMKGQASAFFDDLLANQGGKLSTLLTSETVFVNKDLGPYYGVSGGDTFESAPGTAGATAGILTLPAFLTLLAKPSESSPIYRGKFVREQVLCQLLPAPPANIPKPPEVTPGVSTRERLAEHETNASCSGCHQLVDPIGFGFENYDSLGQYRTMDGDETVDASGEIKSTGEIDGKFVGVTELARKLSQSEIVRQCMARQWFRFALARFEQPTVDDCSMKGVLDVFEGADADLNTLPGAIVESDAFQYRRPVDSEISP
ncbi:MAG: DUF1592 domain-containing protein [Polyangiaceae bacterium]